MSSLLSIKPKHADRTIDLDTLPEGWEWKRLGDVITFEYGKGLREDIRDNGKFPVYGSNGIVGYHSVPLIEKPCIIVGRKGSAGQVHISKVPSWPIDTTYFTTPPENIDLYFLFYLLSTLKLVTLDKSTAIPGLNRNDAYALKIPLPPLPIQRRIVSILEKAEEIKRLRAQADELTDRLLQSVFLEMFGDPVKNPKAWEIEQIDRVCSKVTDGEHNIPPRTGNGIPLLMATNVRDGYVDLTEVAYISEGDHQKSMKRCNPEEGDVLLVCVGATIGRVAIVPKMGQFSLVRSVALLKPNHNKITSQYLLWCLKTKSFQYRLLSRRNTSAQAGLYLNELKKIKLPIPSLFLQQKFARIVEKIESMRQSQNQSKQQIEDLFSALMQKAFRGELER